MVSNLGLGVSRRILASEYCIFDRLLAITTRHIGSIKYLFLIILGHIGSIDIGLKYWYQVIFQILLCTVARCILECNPWEVVGFNSAKTCII